MTPSGRPTARNWRRLTWSAVRPAIKFPLGSVVYETEGFISGAGGTSISPDGTLLAFAEGPLGGNAFTLNTVDRKGHRRAFSNGWPSQSVYIAGWASARELLVAPAAWRAGRDRTLRGGSGRETPRPCACSRTYVFDGHDARWTRRDRAGQLSCRPQRNPPGENGSAISRGSTRRVDDASSDGRTLLITEFGDGGDSGRFSIYLRKVNEALPVRLGDGVGCALSPDGTQVLSIRQSSPPAIIVLPTGPGEPRVVPTPAIAGLQWAGGCPAETDRICRSRQPSGTSSRFVHPESRGRRAPSDRYRPRRYVRISSGRPRWKDRRDTCGQRIADDLSSGRQPTPACSGRATWRSSDALESRRQVLLLRPSQNASGAGDESGTRHWPGGVVEGHRTSRSSRTERHLCRAHRGRRKIVFL